MEDTYTLNIQMDVTSSPEILVVEKVYTDRNFMLQEMTEFVEKFGEPDQGTQTISMTIISARK